MVLEKKHFIKDNQVNLDKIQPRDEAEEKLLQYIENENILPHAALLSERDLESYLNISRTTLNFAIQRLKRQGILYSKRGAGNYVSEPKYLKNLHTLDSWTDFSNQYQLELVSKIREFSIIEADKPLAQKLGIMLGDAIYKLSRIQFINGEPLISETTYLPAHRFDNLDKYDFSKVSLYQVLEKDYNTKAYKGSESIQVILLNVEEAKILQVSHRDPAFSTDALILDIDGIPMEFVHSITRADKFEFGNIIYSENKS